MIKYLRGKQNNLFVPLVFYIKNPGSNGCVLPGKI